MIVKRRKKFLIPFKLTNSQCIFGCGRNIAALHKTQNKEGTNNEFKNMFLNIELHSQQNTLHKAT